MDDEDDDAPSSSSPSPPPPPPPISVVHPSASALPPPPNAHPSHSVTVATPGPLHQTLTLALPIPSPFGGREDCWSEGATSALIDAWGEHFLDLSRGNVKQKHWRAIAEIVSSRDDYSKPPRSDVQCKNRIDTLKKKYKIEKSKLSSSWLFFDRLDFLLAPLLKTPPSALSRFPQKQRSRIPTKRKASASSTSNSLPPADGRRGGVGMRELTRAILRFGEVYQRVESSKLQQAVEMEKQRIGFSRELEMQRMEFFVKTQLELSRISCQLPPGGVGGGGGGNHYLHHSRRRRHQSAGNGRNNGVSG